jgi:hypothetical protein
MAKAMTLRITEEQAEQLEAIARVEGATVSDVVREAVAEKIEQRRKDKDFKSRLKQIIEEDRELLERLAK